LLALGGCSSGTGSRSKPPLPDVDLSAFLPTIQQQLSAALEKARLNPDDATAVGALGMSLHAHEQYGAAEAAYQRAEALAPSDFAWPYYLTMVQQAKGDNDAALGSIARALAIDESQVPAMHLKADLLLAKGQWADARAIVQQILDKNPVQARAHYTMGRVLQGLGELDAAIESLQKACEFFPAYGAAHYAAASAYRQKGDRNQASRHLRAYELHKGLDAPLEDPLWDKVAELNLGPQSHLRRAILFEAKGDLGSAAAANQKALELDPQLVQAHVNLVSLYGRLGEVAKADEHFRAGLQLNPNRDDLYYNHGVLLFQQNKTRAAKIAFERALAINPYHGQAQTNVGFILQAEGRLRESKAMLEKAVQNSPNSRLAHFHLARLLIHDNDLRGGISHLEKTLFPEDEQTPTFLYALAAAHARAKRVDEGLRYAYRARDLAIAHKQQTLLASIQRDIRKMESAR
jgi:tetratricopeptide (TPR) repeat protein